MIESCVKRNVLRQKKNIIATHEKKLRSLTHNSVLPFTADEVITNLSSHVLTQSETDVLKHGF